MTLGWTLDIQSAKGASTVATDVPFSAAAINWTLDGPGSIEVDLKPSHISADWRPGLHRIVAKLDGTPKFAGQLTQLTEDGPPGDLTYKASATGLAALLDWRIVRFQFVIEDTTDNIVAALLDEAQTVQINGDMGMSIGTTSGSFPSRIRSYCPGPVISEEIRSLAALHRGFDWEVDATGAINMWAGDAGRGTDTGLTLDKSVVQDWALTADTSDMLTNVTGLGSQDEPWGPRRVMAHVPGVTAAYGRHETAIDVESTNDNEILDAAYAVLATRIGAMTKLQVMWFEGRDSQPWAFGDVWLADTVDANVTSTFADSDPIQMKCTEVHISLEQNEIDSVQYNFDSLVTDTIFDNDIDESSSS